MNLRAGFFGLALTLGLALSGCGYIGETQPPSLKLPVPVRDFAAVERGSKIIVQFTVPTRTTDDLPLKDTPALTVFIADRHYDVAAKGLLAREEIDASPFYNSDVKASVKAFNRERRDAGYSNVVNLHVVPALEPPANLKAEAVAEGVKVTWDSPEKSFIVFRQGPGETTLTKLDTVAASPFIDKGTEYGKDYLYAVQAVSKDAESELATLAKPLKPEDKFAPAVPQALAAVVGTASVELVWDRAVETDFAGYRIYRDAGTGQFERIGESHDAPSFSDKTAMPGKRYRYAVTAYDKSGNESGLSEAVEALIL